MFLRLTNNPDAAGVGTGAQNAVDCNKSPLSVGRTAHFEYYGNGMTGAPVIVLEGSDDGGATWTALVTLTTAEALASHVKKEVQLRKKMRLNKTTAATGGLFTGYLVAPPI